MPGSNIYYLDGKAPPLLSRQRACNRYSVLPALDLPSGPSEITIMNLLCAALNRSEALRSGAAPDKLLKESSPRGCG